MLPLVSTGFPTGVQDMNEADLLPVILQDTRVVMRECWFQHLAGTRRMSQVQGSDPGC